MSIEWLWDIWYEFKTVHTVLHIRYYLFVFSSGSWLWLLFFLSWKNHMNRLIPYGTWNVYYAMWCGIRDWLDAYENEYLWWNIHIMAHCFAKKANRTKEKKITERISLFALNISITCVFEKKMSNKRQN